MTFFMVYIDNFFSLIDSNCQIDQIDVVAKMTYTYYLETKRWKSNQLTMCIQIDKHEEEPAYSKNAN